MAQKPALVVPIKSAIVKQPWRKPTLTFVPLQITANSSGSGPDGLTVEADG